MMELAAAILAGGESARMGQDKALMDWRGKTFLQHVIDEVSQLEVPIYLSGQEQKLAAFGFPVIEDSVSNQGPVVALASCFNKIKAEQILVLSCDVPQIKFSELKRLITAHQQADVTMFQSGTKKLPLVAVYNQSCSSAFQAAMENGERKLFSVIDKLETKTIQYNGELHNVNSPQDLELIK